MTSQLECSQYSGRKSRSKILEDHIKGVASHSTTPMDNSGSGSGRISHVDGKENVSDEVRMRTITKSKLKRMGVLYTDSENLSSPLQRTEEKFSIEGERIVERPSAKSEARSARLARLANFINQWEDDLSHPVINKEPPLRLDKFGNILSGSPPKRMYGKPLEIEMERKKTQPLKEITDSVIREKSVSPARKANVLEKPVIVKESLKREFSQDLKNEPVQPKRVMWDSTMIASLESKGFERCESKQHLVYDYKEPSSPAKCLSPSRKTKELKQPKPVVSSPIAFPSSSVSPVKFSPNKNLRVTAEEGSDARKQAVLLESIVRELSPTKVENPGEITPSSGKKAETFLKESKVRSPSPRKNTQVLEMAAQYEEASSPNKRIKETDPSELPLSQRMALFEKNKGNAILPKAPFSHSVPQKVLAGNASSDVYLTPVSKTASSSSLEKPSTEKLKQIRQEREKEMDALKSRWDKARAKLSPLKSPPSPISKTETPVTPQNKIPVAPLLPESDSDDLPETPKSEMSADSELPQCPNTGDYSAPLSPPRHNSSYQGIKKIKISPPKYGHLYPSISDIETETESEFNENNNFHSSVNDDSINSEASTIESLGQKIVQVAKKSLSNLKRINSTSEEEVRVLGEMDDFLDEALGEPSPPKKSRDSSFDSYMDEELRRCDSGSVGSNSFEFRNSTGSLSAGQLSSSAGGQTQLVHTISLYRKQKKMTIKSMTTVSREEVTKFNQPIIEEAQDEVSDQDSDSSEQTEDQLVTNKIHDLSLEVSRQQTVISQASQALNLCSSTIEFCGSAEQIEAEKLLLIASQRRLALTHEIERLRVEKTIKPGGSNNSMEQGNLTIENITLPLKMDVIRASAREEKCWYMLVLARCGPTVVSSDMVAALPKNLKQTEPHCVSFKSPIILKGLYSDFAVTLEIYALEARSKELLPHDVKYHLTPSAKKSFVSNYFAMFQRLGSPKKSIFSFKDKLRMTPKKGNKNDTRLIIGPIESPAGPLAVRSSAFKLNGFSVFSLRDIKKSCFSLNKVQYSSVVEGSIQVKMSCEMTLAGLEYRGFLTMFQDVSGFGAWHRRWCYLKDNTISYWLYPEHENSKVPIDTIDLSEVVCDGEVGLVSRDICARPNTFLLEVLRPRLPSDQDSLIMKTNKNTTLIKHLLSADTKEDRLEWCTRINKYLSLLKAWGKRPAAQHTSV